MRTKIDLRKISDRQGLIPVIETRKQGLEPYMHDRLDMFWVEIELTDDGLKAEIVFSIESSELKSYLQIPSESWYFSLQYGAKVLYNDSLRTQMLNVWLMSGECMQASSWLGNLEQAGYFDSGCFGARAPSYASCIHCGYYFEKGTSHPHTYLCFSEEKKVIYHHKQMEKTILEKGLKKLGVSRLPDEPSLEELGVLSWHTVGEDRFC